MTQHVVCKNKELEDVTCIFSPTCRFCVTFERSLAGLLITVVRWFWTQRSMDDAVLSSHLVLVVLVDGADSDGGPHRIRSPEARKHQQGSGFSPALLLFALNEILSFALVPRGRFSSRGVCFT